MDWFVFVPACRLRGPSRTLWQRRDGWTHRAWSRSSRRSCRRRSFAGPAAHDDLAAYYFAANPQLCERLEAAKRAFENPSKKGLPYRAMTLIAGDAGVGKTFLKGQVFSGKYPKDAVFKFDIREMYEKWQQADIATLKPDLCDGGAYSTRCRRLSDATTRPLYTLLASKTAAFYVVDSLDELHPDDYLNSLRQIEDFVTNSKQDFIHAVVFARPFAFLDYWQQRSPQSDAVDVALFMLAPPQLRTTGDMLVSNWNYATYKFKPQWKSPEGKEQPLSLQDYAAWEQAGFDRTGRFAKIACEANREITPEVIGAFMQYAQQSRVVGATLYNLAGNSLSREIVADRTSRGLPFNEREFMDAYFNAWLERDYASDKRPSPSHPEYLDLYVQLLESIATRTVEDELVDDQGFFVLEPDDRVEVEHDGAKHSFPVQQVLNRSGMKHLDPRQSGPARYRFEPIWFHRLLVERHNERMSHH